MKKYVIIGLMLAILFGHAHFFGANDYLAVVLLLVTASILYLTVAKLHAGNRKMMRVNARPGSWLHGFLSKEATLLMRVVALVSSLTLSVILMVLIKGMVIQQGNLPFFIVVVVASLLLYSFVNNDHRSRTAEDNLHEDIVVHGSEVARIFYAAIIMNFVLAFAFSAHDTYGFKTSEVNFSNFTDMAVEASIEKTDDNKYSRIFINAYLLMDYVKIALAKMFVSLFSLQDNFYFFYLSVFFLNLFKLFAFSFSFVLVQKGLDGLANVMTPTVERMRISFGKVVVEQNSRYLLQRKRSERGVTSGKDE